MPSIVGRLATFVRDISSFGIKTPFQTDPVREVQLFGYSVRLSVREQIQRAILLGKHEREESGWLSRHLQPGMTFCDVGANVGYFALLAASRVGEMGRVICFEPSPYCNDILVRTKETNRISQMIVRNQALADAPGQLDLVCEHRDLHSPSFLAKDGDHRFSVPVTTLDAYLSVEPVERIDVLKVDVEGFEPNVIRGAANALATGRIRNVLIELNDVWLSRNSSSSEELDGLIRSFGLHSTMERAYAYHKNVWYSMK